MDKFMQKFSSLFNTYFPLQ